MATQTQSTDPLDSDMLGPIQTETMTLNMGPQHPSTHGVLRVVLELDGETVLSCKPVIGYLHTGIEKNMEEKTYNKALPMTDRMDYLAPMSNNLGFVLAVEKLLDMEVPRRCKYLRVLLAEMTRLNSHLVWLGTHALDLGAMTVFLYCFREREQLLKIFEKVSGVRMMTSYFRVGGVAREPYLEFYEDCRAFLEPFSDRVDEYEELLTNNPIYLRRAEGVCAMTVEEAYALGITGPLLRACGVPTTSERTSPTRAMRSSTSRSPWASGAIFWTGIWCGSPRCASPGASPCRRSRGCPRGRSWRTTPRWCRRPRSSWPTTWRR